MNEEDAILHYIKYGYVEKRIANSKNLEKFDPVIYKELNNDLNHLSDYDAVLHYIRHGKYEKREYSLDIFNNIYQKTTLIISDKSISDKSISDLSTKLKIDDLFKLIQKHLDTYLNKYRSLIDQQKINLINSKINQIIEIINPKYIIKYNLIIKYISSDQILDDFIANKFSVLNFFDKIFIINLKYRIDRKEHILKQINRFNLNSNKYEIVEAIYDSNGVIGCAKSHIKCLKMAKENKLKNVLILEDDYTFCEDLEQFEKQIITFLKQNIKWDILLLHFSNFGPPIYIKTNIDNLYKFYWSFSTASYIANNTIFDELIELYNLTISTSEPIDWLWNNKNFNYDCYCIKDTVGNQIESFSDIEKKIVKYTKPIF
jgi:GR25 family glycosyltransferase involved in LPS biosynthesis